MKTILDIDSLQCFKNLISPAEDEGLDYIWFAKYPNDKIMVEYDDDKNKSSFDDAYASRYFVKEFGLFGNKQKFSFDIEDGAIKREKDYHPEHNTNEVSYLSLYIKANGTIYNFNRPDNDYTNFTARKYIHADAVPGAGIQTVSPSIDCFAVGYKTHVPFSDVEFDLEVLYLIYKDSREMLKVSITPNKNFDGVLFAGKHGSLVKLNKDTRSDFVMQLKKMEL